MTFQHQSDSQPKNVLGEQHVFRICLTGGPCGGKTTSIAQISQYFTNMGWRVYVARETATILLGGGIPIGELSEDQIESLQTSIVKVMMSIEDSYYQIAQLDQSKPTLIICDRGVMDASAYCSPEQWKKILSNLNLEEPEVKEHRYDCVIHLVTAADGAEMWYTLDNTEVRSEGLEQARSLDQKLMKAWMGHPNLFVISNNSVKDFEQKVNMGIRALCTKIGVQAPVDRYEKKKYLITLPSEEQLSSLDSKEFDCVFSFLSRVHGSPLYHTATKDQPTSNSSSETRTIVDTQIRVRKRGREGSFWQYTSTTRRIFSPNPVTGKKEYIETKRNISPTQYFELLTFALTTHHPVSVKRYSFVHKNQYFELDIFQEPLRFKGLSILSSYVHGEEAPLPSDWLNIEKEITDDPHYSLFNLAKKRENEL